MKIEIKHRWSGAVLFSVEAGNMRLAVEAAVKAKADLRAANLRAANLRDADLRAANLRDADLRAADLRAADLRDADLRDADLRDANLRDADLRDANLRDADLRDADLRDANLRAANLRAANLRDADLRAANLTSIRDDLWAVLSAAPREVAGLRKALVDGNVDGTAYSGDCACLVGTIANIRHVSIDSLGCLRPNSSRPAERFFLSILPGDTPDKNQFAKIAVEWIDEWTANVSAAFALVK